MTLIYRLGTLALQCGDIYIYKFFMISFCSERIFEILVVCFLLDPIRVERLFEEHHVCSSDLWAIWVRNSTNPPQRTLTQSYIALTLLFSVFKFWKLWDVSFSQDLAIDATTTVGVDLGQGLREVDIKKYIKVEKIPGGQLEDSQVLKGVMFNKDVVAPGKMRRKIVNPLIIFLDAPLE